VALPSVDVLFLEFAAQGIRGVAPPGGRATLRPGYNVVAADGAALARLLRALLYPAPQDGEELGRQQGPANSGPVRAGLTLVGDDRVTYRLVRDFAAGCQLHRFEPEKRAFVPVSQDLAEIAGLLRSTIGVPSPTRLGALLSLSVAELPSRAVGALASTPSLPATARQALSGEAARKRLEELRAELERARVAEKLQGQLDVATSRLFKLEEALKSGLRVQEAVAAAAAERGSLQPVAEATAALGDPAVRFAAYEKAAGKRQEAEGRIAAERQAIEEAQARGAPAPAWKEPPFLAGVGAGLVLLLVGQLAGDSDVRYLSLLDIPAFGWSAWLLLHWIDAQEAWGRLARRSRVIDDWEAKVQAQFARDAGPVNDALQGLGLRQLPELREALERLAAADRAVAEARQLQAEWESDAQTTDALAERGRVEEEMKAIEGQLSAQAGGFVRDVQAIELELARVEAEAAAPAPAAPAPMAVPTPARPLVAVASGEPLRGLLERAAAELGGSAPSVARALSVKASQAVAAFTLNRLTGVSADDRGNVQVMSGGRTLPAMTLPPAERDMVYLALKLALLEQALAGGKSVALLEDAFAGLSDGVRRTAGRLIKAQARPGQVLHATTDPAFREAADHQV
jgi:hypothetical protein